MIPRGKKVTLLLLGACLLGLYFYKMADFHQTVPVFITKRLAHLNNKLEDVKRAHYRKKETDVKKHDEKHVLSSKDTTELFKNSIKCLSNAKRNVAGYLRETNDIGNIRNYDTPLEPICDMGNTLIILVTTRPSNFANRVAIRLSWGRMDSALNSQVRRGHPELTWQTIFTVGLAKSRSIGGLVALESKQYQDVLRLPYKDSYDNLPNKTMNSLEWIANNCKAKFVLKTDDDCFVNVFQMLPWLSNLPHNYQYMGRVNDNMPVIRDPKHRNFVPKHEHQEEMYKPYCAGGGYILRVSVLKNITDMGKRIKQIINEDAYMGMLTNALRIIPRNDERFLPFIFFGPSLKKSNMCDWKRHFLMHNVFGKRQLVMHYNSIAMTYFHSLCEII